MHRKATVLTVCVCMCVCVCVCVCGWVGVGVGMSLLPAYIPLHVQLNRRTDLLHQKVFNILKPLLSKVRMLFAYLCLYSFTIHM